MVVEEFHSEMRYVRMIGERIVRIVVTHGYCLNASVASDA